jgi:peptidoglycan/xylan/chitin deacetylase (PgdA/CDA1 family)
MVSHSGLLLQRLIYRNRFARAISYHSTPHELSQNLEAHLRYFQRYFRPIMRLELENLMLGGTGGGKPGLLISFDDHRLSQYEVAAPLLEKYGFRGWFFVCSGEIESMSARDRYGPGEHNMSWAQLRELQQRDHIIGSHTSTHETLSEDVDADVLETQIAGSKKRLEEELGVEVDSFCWVGSEASGHSIAAARLIRDSGYRFAFCTSSAPIHRRTEPLMIHRTSVDISYSVSAIRLALSGAADIWFRGRRRRINETLAQAQR